MLDELKLFWSNMRKSGSISESTQYLTGTILSLFAALPFVLLIVYPGAQTVWEIIDFTVETRAKIAPFDCDVLKICNKAIVFLGLYATLVYALACIYQKKKFFSIPLVFFLAYVVWTVAITLHDGITVFELTGLGQILDQNGEISFLQNESIFTYVMYVCTYYLCAQIIDSEEVKLYLCRLHLLVSMFVALCAISTMLYLTPEVFHVFDVEAGPHVNFWQHNHYGYYLVMSVMISAGLLVFRDDGKWNVLYALSFFANVFALTFNDTFGAYLATVLSIVFILVLMVLTGRISWKSFLLVVVLFFVANVFANVVDYRHPTIRSLGKFTRDLLKIAADPYDAGNAGSSRWKLWMTTIEIMREEPSSWLIGTGLDGIAQELQLRAGAARTHNEYLQLLAFWGLPGLALYLSGVFSVFIRGLKNRKIISPMALISLVAVFGYLVSATFGVTFFYTMPFMFMFLGFGARYGEELECAEAQQTVSRDDGAAPIEVAGFTVKEFLITLLIVACVALATVPVFSAKRTECILATNVENFKAAGEACKYRVENSEEPYPADEYLFTYVSTRKTLTDEGEAKGESFAIDSDLLEEAADREAFIASGEHPEFYDHEFREIRVLYHKDGTCEFEVVE